jgi:type IV pilus biogenesis protein CpaD/CtpE
MKTSILNVLLACVAAGLAACATTDVNRSVCEGMQTRVRVVDPLADPKMPRDQPSCEAYEAERARLTKPE